MAKSVLVDLHMNDNQIMGLRLEVLATDPDPGDLVEGRVWYNSTTHVIKYYDGTDEIAVGIGIASLTVDDSSIENTGSAGDPSIRVKALGITNAMLAGSIANTKLATNPLARANHTGDQLASTISNFDTAVRTSRLDQMAVPTSSVSLNSQKITNLADPTGDQDAATKLYVDLRVNGLAYKDGVRAATTANGTLATAFDDGSVIDGVTLATGDRILVKNQSSGSENGIYVVAASGAPTRATDADSSDDLIGAAVFVSEGTTNGNTMWVMTTDGAITVNTTALVWSQFGGPGAVTAGAGITVTGQSVALDVPVTIARGGTGQTTAALAIKALGGLTPYAVDIGGSTSVTVTHNLNTRDVFVTVFSVGSPYDEIECTIERTTVNTITVKFSTAPAAGAYRCIVAALPG